MVVVVQPNRFPESGGKQQNGLEESGVFCSAILFVTAVRLLELGELAMMASASSATRAVQRHLRSPFSLVWSPPG